MPDTPPPALAAVRDDGDPAARDAAQYHALRTAALLVDHPGRAVWIFRGPQARATLGGLVTNDVEGLAAGHGCYAAALTPKGRVIADVRVFALDAGGAAAAPTDQSNWLDGAALVVDVPPRAAAGWEAMVRKFVNPRLAKYRHVDTARVLGLYGPRVRDAVAAAFGAAPSALAALPPYAHATVTLAGGATLLVARVPDAGGPAAGVDGFLVLASDASYPAARERLTAAPSLLAGDEAAYHVARVEAGYPAWGVDIDDTTIPQEANFDELGALSYTKGCYTGQEVVARVHFRGHVNRHLRGLRLADGIVPSGAALVDEADKPVGDVRSVVLSPRLGPVALGMVRREVPIGARLCARWTDDAGRAHEREATVAALPFAPARPEAAPA